MASAPVAQKAPAPQALHALARRVYAEVGGSVKHIASYEALIAMLTALPRTMMPTRFDTEEIGAGTTEITRHEIALVDLRVAGAA